jgi:cytochrome P450
MVVDPALAVAVQRASSTLDFDEVVVQATPRLVKLNAQTTSILQDPTAKEEGRKRMVAHAHGIINPPLAAHNIWSISQSQLDHFGNYINKFSDGEVDLYKFFTRELVAATMHSMYGPQNPFAVRPELLEKFWEWDDGNIGYAMSAYPQITARKAYKAMEECLQGWVEYTEKGRHSEAQPFLKTRYDMHMDAGISNHEHARLEMGIILGFNSNASVTTFWIMNNIFSRPELLQQIREEVQANAFEAPGTISATKVKDSCPLLNSVFRETLRLAAPMTSARVVLEDTIIADTYLLKKGNVVQIAGGVMNSDTEIWGPDASSFNPRRFFYTPNGTNPDGSISDTKANTVHPAAFRSFGGGASLCPGRHFAQIEVTSLAAMMALGFDMKPVEGMTEVGWNPPKDDKRFPLVVTKPTQDVRVKIVRRKGWEDVKWDLKV